MPTTYPGLGSMYPSEVSFPSGLYGGMTPQIYSNANLTPGVTGSAILDKFVLPASSLGRTAQGLYFVAYVTTAANTNAKTVTLNFAGTGAVGVAPTGGTTLISATTSTSAIPLFVQAWVFRTALSAQTFVGFSAINGTLSAPTSGTMTVTETAGIQLNLVANAATTATDLVLQFWSIQFLA